MICMFIVVLGCKKDHVAPTPPVDNIDLHKYPGLPDATQSGENTMGCLINGETWVPKVDGVIGWPSPHKMSVWYGELGKSLGIIDQFSLRIYCIKLVGRNEKLANFDIDESFSIEIKPIKSLEKASIQNKEFYYIEYFKRNNFEPWKLYILDTLAPANIEITKLDTLHNIVSGLFNFRLKEIDDSKDTLRITNGRFDAKYLGY